jgi:hypothetical protein
VTLVALACLASFALGWYLSGQRYARDREAGRLLRYQNKLLRQQVQDLAAGEPPANGSRSIPHPHQIEPR